jgi:high-affinity K+ transport system ATPase subunit B
MIAFLLTPIGRYVAIAIIAVVALTGVYYKIRADAIAEIEAAAQADVLRRTQNAIHAGDSVADDPAKLRERDKHQRD